MTRRIIILLILVIYLNSSFGQFFEGQIEYVSSYLNKTTLKPLLADIPETVTIKGGKYKIYIPNAQGGQLEWKIDNFYDGNTFSRKSYKNSSYPVSDKEPVISNDGTLTFPKSDSPVVASIMKGKLCGNFIDTSRRFVKLDTTVTINNLSCSVVIEYTNGSPSAEYYCYSKIKLDPTLYNCQRNDGLDNIYRYTAGSLIAQLVLYDEAFIYIYQVQNIKAISVSDSEFDIPKGIKIEEMQN